MSGERFGSQENEVVSSSAFVINNTTVVPVENSLKPQSNAAIIRGWESESGSPVVCIVPRLLLGHTPLNTLKPVSLRQGKGYVTEQGYAKINDVTAALHLAQGYPFRRYVKRLGSGMEGVALGVTVPQTGETIVVKKSKRFSLRLFVILSKLFGEYPNSSVKTLNNEALRLIIQESGIDGLGVPKRLGFFSSALHNWEVMEFAPGRSMSSKQFETAKTLHEALRRLRISVASLLVAPNGDQFGITDVRNTRNIIASSSATPSFWLLDQ